MRQELGFRKQESSLILALNLHKALRDRLAAEKRHLRLVMRTARPLKRYRFDL